jgi:hypothetical protein
VLVNPNNKEINVSFETQEKDSVLNYYKRLLTLRKQEKGLFIYLFTYLLLIYIYSFIYLFIYFLFIHLFSYLLFHLFIYLSRIFFIYFFHQKKLQTAFIYGSCYEILEDNDSVWIYCRVLNGK